MIRRLRGRPVTLVLIALMAFGFSGCIEYTIETRVNADGSGHRSVRVEGTDAHRLDESKVTYDEFTEFMSLSEEDGWTHAIETQSDGDTVYVFTKEESLSDLSSWSSLTDEIHITGARESTAGDQIGYVTLGDVVFRNSVRVRSGGNEDGAATFSYEETFRWRNAVDVFFESIVRELERSIEHTYPLLTQRDRGEIVGMARSNLWAGAEEGLLDSIGEEDDVLWARFLDQTTSQGIKIVQTKYVGATTEALRSRLDLMSDEFEEEAWDDLNYRVPGLSAATNSNFKFYLTMPGQVTTTNAHSRDGDVLIWEFSPADALEAPIVLVAESVVGG